jgi:hypothetical protein
LAFERGSSGARLNAVVRAGETRGRHYNRGSFTHI